jgi:hypothetical protein
MRVSVRSAVSRRHGAGWGLACVLVSVAASLSCQTPPPRGVPAHCREEWEWRGIEGVGRHRAKVFALDEDGKPGVVDLDLIAHLDRDDYLEAYCRGANDYRGDERPEGE